MGGGGRPQVHLLDEPHRQHHRARQPQRRSGKRQPELHHRSSQLPSWGGGRPQLHLLREQRRSHDRARRPRRHEPQPGLHHHRHRPPGGGRRRLRGLLDERQPRHHRARQPRRRSEQRQPELHLRCYAASGLAVDAAHIYWTNYSCRHDRPRQHQRRSEQRQPELHHRCRRPPRGGGRRQGRHLCRARGDDRRHRALRQAAGNQGRRRGRGDGRRRHRGRSRRR